MSMPRQFAKPAAMLFASLLAMPAMAQSRLQILHASDLEGSVEAVTEAPNFAAVVEALEARANLAGIPSILLSAGDNYIPGPFFSAAGDSAIRAALQAAVGNPNARELEGRVDIAIMNVLGMDASALGNHEFDAGTRTIRDLIGTDIRPNDPRWLGAQFPYLSANLDFSGDANLASVFTAQLLPSTAFQSPLNNLPQAAAAPKLAPAALIVRGNETYGVVGATTPLLATISSPGATVVRNPGAGTNDMASLAAILQPTIDSITQLGVNKIILVSHLQQIALEQQLVGLLRDVDVVIAGGSDTILANPGNRLRAGNTAQGPYPIVAADANQQPVLLVSTDGQYRYVGCLVVDFNAQGIVQPTSILQGESGAFATDTQGVIDLWGNTTAPFAAGTKGATVRLLTDAVQQVVTVKDGNIFGRASVFLEGRRTPSRTEQTNLGDLTADANLAAARQLDASVLVSIKNGGGIRNPIGSVDGLTGALGPTRANPLSGKQSGEISQLDIEDSLRFNNGLSLVTLTRSQLRQVLEHAIAATAPGATPGQFGQFGGIAFSFDASRPVGSRVRFAALTEPGVPSPVLVADGRVIGGRPVRVVTLDFLASGGDSYPFNAFIAADPQFANRVDLRNANLPPGAATFAPAGSEQDAMAEYLLANFTTSPYSTPDTPVFDDLRIQQLRFRAEEVLAFANPQFGIDVHQDVAACGPLNLNVVGTAPNALLFNLIAVSCNYGNGPLFGIGGEAFAQLGLGLGFEPFHVMADSNGVYNLTVNTACTLSFGIEAVTLEITSLFGNPFLNRVSRPTGCTTISL